MTYHHNKETLAPVKTDAKGKVTRAAMLEWVSERVSAGLLTSEEAQIWIASYDSARVTECK